MKRTMLLMTILWALCSAAGCPGPSIVKHPDASMMIEEVHWDKSVSVAVYDKQNNRLVHYGRVKVPVGWTLRKFDWEKYIASQTE